MGVGPVSSSGRWSRRAPGMLAVGALLFLVGGGARAEERGSRDGVWQGLVALRRPDGAGEAWPAPVRYRAVAANALALREALATAPDEPPIWPAPPEARGAILSIPTPAGAYERFEVFRSPVMEPDLQAAFPEIETYVGQGLDDPAATLRCDWTPFGFHAMVLSPSGSYAVDPVWRGDVTTYACSRAEDAMPRLDPFSCGTVSSPLRALRVPGSPAALTSGTTLRTYRLAMAATGEYTAYFGGTVPLALAAMATLLTRVNGIYEREVAVRMVLVATNANVVFTNGATDPFTTSGTGALTNPNAEAQAAIDAAPPAGVGNANYDIGHLVHAGPGGGNAGGIGTVCQAGIKGAAFTAINPPVGDFFYVDYVAHEMGHQFGGNHTWTGCPPQFDEDNPVKYEPGSGTTIMSYVGICGADDVPGQPQPDPGAVAPRGFADAYFHSGSLDQIVAYTTAGAGSGCPTATPTGNNPPTVDAGPDRTIPKGTPFVLAATGSDPDGDALTYCWEQRDAFPDGPDALLADPDDGVLPLFRSFPPTTSVERTFPRLADLVAGNLFPGSLGEQLPTQARAMDFRVTVRDNRAGGGGIGTDDLVVNVDATTGPFRVTSPNGGESWAQGTAQTVTWDVAGTDGAPVGAANVRILLSTDGGLTYPTTLLASTPNDGSESVTLPACDRVTTGRLRVEAVGNVFFDISDADFSIVDVTPPTVTAAVTRGVLWPATRGLLDVGLSHSAVDNCPGVVTLVDARVHSDEGHGAAPYVPDATLVGSTLRLRAERAIPGDGRVFLAAPRYQDAAGNRGVGVASVVVPGNLTVAHMTALLLDASLKRAACEAAGGAAPAGHVQILP